MKQEPPVKTVTPEQEPAKLLWGFFFCITVGPLVILFLLLMEGLYQLQEFCKGKKASTKAV
ncbi:hypothetical protein KY346_03795 [Candidatus Woesearchaeota archaeon]|nr:hypothetical protein [Candidatus Woesearchaeota archaeon]